MREIVTSQKIAGELQSPGTRTVTDDLGNRRLRRSRQVQRKQRSVGRGRILRCHIEDEEGGGTARSTIRCRWIALRFAWHRERTGADRCRAAPGRAPRRRRRARSGACRSECVRTGGRRGGARAGRRRGCPIPASSGKTQRHRLNRGGNRQANSALHMVVVCRMRTDQRTRAYVARRTQEGLSKREVMRCLKRYVAREIYRVLTAPSSA